MGVQAPKLPGQRGRAVQSRQRRVFAGHDIFRNFDAQTAVHGAAAGGRDVGFFEVGLNIDATFAVLRGVLFVTLCAVDPGHSLRSSFFDSSQSGDHAAGGSVVGPMCVAFFFASAPPCSLSFSSRLF
jgi:hypothetical protein